MLNWIVWNWTDYLHKNGFGINLQRLICHKTQPTNRWWFRKNLKFMERILEKKLSKVVMVTYLGMIIVMESWKCGKEKKM